MANIKIVHLLPLIFYYYCYEEHLRLLMNDLAGVINIDIRNINMDINMFHIDDNIMVENNGPLL